MTAIETAMLMHLALLANDPPLHDRAYMDFLADAATERIYLGRIKHLHAILDAWRIGP